MKPKSRLRCALIGTSVIFLTLHHATAADGSWNVDDNGFWSEEEKWTPGVADGDGFTAFFTNDQTVDAIVTLDSPRTIGPAGKLRTNSGGVTFGHPLAGSGTLDIVSNAEVRYSGNWSAFTGTTTVRSGTLRLHGASVTTGATTVAGGCWCCAAITAASLPPRLAPRLAAAPCGSTTPLPTATSPASSPGPWRSPRPAPAR